MPADGSQTRVTLPVTYAENADCSVLAVDTSCEDGRAVMREIMAEIRNSPAMVASRRSAEYFREQGLRCDAALKLSGGNKDKALALVLSGAV